MYQYCVDETDVIVDAFLYDIEFYLCAWTLIDKRGLFLIELFKFDILGVRSLANARVELDSFKRGK